MEVVVPSQVAPPSLRITKEMFTEADGATALRHDLVCALSFSLDVVELSGPGGLGRYCASLGAVWNGTKGYVAVLLRQLNEASLRRFEFDQALMTPEAVASAVDEGIAFVESMGFTMDHPEFRSLAPDEQNRRLEQWNDVRKIKRRIKHVLADGDVRTGDAPLEERPRKHAADAEPEPGGEEAFEGWDIEAHETEPDAAAAPVSGDDSETSERGKSVLGRLSLVRKKADDDKLDPIARLLSYF